MTNDVRTNQELVIDALLAIHSEIINNSKLSPNVRVNIQFLINRMLEDNDFVVAYFMLISDLIYKVPSVTEGIKSQILIRLKNRR